MNTALFSLSIEFDPLLPAYKRSDRRNGLLEYQFSGKPSVKHALEAMGIPHTEIGGVHIDGRASHLDDHLLDGNLVQVLAYTESPTCLLDLSDGPIRFILDNHLGKLNTYLRMLGFDCFYDPVLDDAAIAHISHAEGRILLSRDRQLLMRCEVTQGCWIRLKIPVEQVKQVIARYHLANQVKPLSRCLRCNHVLVPVNKQDILHRLEPLTIQFHETFRICPDCGQIYWSGSHAEHMQKLIDEILTTK